MAGSRSNVVKRFGIMNHVGSIWSPDSWDREEDAQAYLDAQRVECARKYGMDLSKHHVVRVRVTVTPLAPTQGPRP